MGIAKKEFPDYSLGEVLKVNFEKVRSIELVEPSQDEEASKRFCSKCEHKGGACTGIVEGKATFRINDITSFALCAVVPKMLQEEADRIQEALGDQIMGIGEAYDFVLQHGLVSDYWEGVNAIKRGVDEGWLIFDNPIELTIKRLGDNPPAVRHWG